ncbi:MAG: 50S ribosomal protein L5 [Bacteroidales bacterium]
MKYVPSLQKKYGEEIIPSLQKEFGYKSIMQVPRLEKIVINQGIGQAIQDKKILEFSVNELTAITGQKPVVGNSTKDVSNFKLRIGMPIGVKVTLRREKMYEFLERLVTSALPRIRDFKGIDNKLDGHGNYTLGIEEQIIFPEIVLDKVHKLMGMNVTLVTSANTDEEGYALLKDFGIPFKKIN